MAEKKPSKSRKGPVNALRGFSAPGGSPDADRLIHERVRLAIVSALAVHDKLTFNELKEMLQTTDGNLSVHARKLEEAELVFQSESDNQPLDQSQRNRLTKLVHTIQGLHFTAIE